MVAVLVVQVVEQRHSVHAGLVQIAGRTWLFRFRIAVYLLSLGFMLSLRTRKRMMAMTSRFKFAIFV